MRRFAYLHLVDVAQLKSRGCPSIRFLLRRPGRAFRWELTGQNYSAWRGLRSRLEDWKGVWCLVSSHSRIGGYRGLGQAVDGPRLAQSWSATT